MRFGEELREQRERLGISLDDVAVSTRVSTRHLLALEEERFAELPGGVFSRGIVRSYAQHCGMNAESTVQNFVNALRRRGLDVEGRDDDWVELAEAVHRSRPAPLVPRGVRWAGVMAMVLAVLVLTIGVLLLLQQRGMVKLPHSLHDVVEQVKQIRGASAVSSHPAP